MLGAAWARAELACESAAERDSLVGAEAQFAFSLHGEKGAPLSERRCFQKPLTYRQTTCEQQHSRVQGDSPQPAPCRAVAAGQWPCCVPIGTSFHPA